MSGRAVLKRVLLEDCLWEYLFFLQNLTGNLRTSFFPESWSLSVEEWFYLLFPVCLFVIQGVKLNKRLVLLSVIFVSIIAPSIARYQLSDIHSTGTWMLTRMVVIMRLDSIGFGVLLAYVVSFDRRHGKDGRDPRFYWLLACLVLPLILDHL